MKSRLNILLWALAAMLTASVASCSDDDFTASIFDTTDKPLDRSSYSFPLDTFAKVNFQEPYNMKFIYRMEDIGSDNQKNLVPVAYDKAVDVAVLSKYLWYDVYKKLAGEHEVFLKQYSPRIMHIIGSASYNPSTGTMTLGTAEGGLKITLYRINEVDPNNIDEMNEFIFKTMHHEFAHILDQTKSRPTSFNIISNGLYNATDWSSKNDTMALAQGFVTPYASSQAREDWVEVMANYIVKDTATWEGMLNTASYDWEDVTTVDEEFYKSLIKTGCNMDSVGYSYYKNSEFHVVRKRILRNEAGYAMDGKITYTDNEDGVDGKAIILQKLQLVRNWLKESFDISIDAMRQEVQRLQYVTNADGSFKRDADGNVVNALIQPTLADPSVSVIDSLRQEVYQYKALQGK